MDRFNEVRNIKGNQNKKCKKFSGNLIKKYLFKDNISNEKIHNLVEI